MSLQESVSIYVSPALPGMMTSAFVASSVDSNSLAAASPSVSWGDAVFYGTVPGTVRQAQVGDTLANFAGFVVRNAFQENIAGGGFQYYPGDTLPNMRIGEMFVPCINDVVPGATTYIILNNADATKIGKLTKTADSTNTLALDGRFRGIEASPAAGGVAKISLVQA